MVFDSALISVVIGFMVLANRLVDALATPLFERYNLEKFWLMYVSWALAGVLVYLTGYNLFAFYFRDLLVGQIFTAIVAGGGANLLHDLTDKQPTVS